MQPPLFFSNSWQYRPALLPRIIFECIRKKCGCLVSTPKLTSSNPSSGVLPTTPSKPAFLRCLSGLLEFHPSSDSGFRAILDSAPSLTPHSPSLSKSFGCSFKTHPDPAGRHDLHCCNADPGRQDLLPSRALCFHQNEVQIMSLFFSQVPSGFPNQRVNANNAPCGPASLTSSPARSPAATVGSLPFL